MKLGRLLMVIVPVLIILSIIGLILQNPYLLKERKSDIISPSIESLDNIVNDAIIHCETDGRFCDKTMPSWLELCKNESAYKDVPSCNDGRIERLIENPIKMSEECEELHEIMKNIIANNKNDQLPIEFRLAMNDFDRLGCPYSKG